jgi:hypothetical protein
MPVLTAHYVESLYKTSLYREFLNLYCGGHKRYFNYRNHYTEPTLRSDMDPNMLKHLLSVGYNNNIIA